MSFSFIVSRSNHDTKLNTISKIVNSNKIMYWYGVDMLMTVQSTFPAAWLCAANNPAVHVRVWKLWLCVSWLVIILFGPVFLSWNYASNQIDNYWRHAWKKIECYSLHVCQHKEDKIWIGITDYWLSRNIVPGKFFI